MTRPQANTRPRKERQAPAAGAAAAKVDKQDAHETVVRAGRAAINREIAGLVDQHQLLMLQTVGAQIASLSARATAAEAQQRTVVYLQELEWAHEELQAAQELLAETMQQAEAVQARLTLAPVTDLVLLKDRKFKRLAPSKHLMVLEANQWTILEAAEAYYGTDRSAMTRVALDMLLAVIGAPGGEVSMAPAIRSAEDAVLMVRELRTMAEGWRTAHLRQQRIRRAGLAEESLGAGRERRPEDAEREGLPPEDPDADPS